MAWRMIRRPNRHLPKSGAHCSTGDCQPGTPRHRRSPSSNKPFYRRNRPTATIAHNWLIGRCSCPQNHELHKRLPAPLRDPPHSYVIASWTMAVKPKATRPTRRPVTGRKRGADKETGWSLEFEIDSGLPVTDVEIQVLETWLGRQLDALFESPHSPQKDIAAPDKAINPSIRKWG